MLFLDEIWLIKSSFNMINSFKTISARVYRIYPLLTLGVKFFTLRNKSYALRVERGKLWLL